MEVITLILISLIADSLLGLIGVFSLFIKEKYLKFISKYLVSFAAGALFAGTFFHLLPESFEKLDIKTSFITLTISFIFFFLLERILSWHHCHEEKCKVHPFSYLILLGDGIHNIIDGIIIAATYLIDINLGVITTLLIILHEVPQEIGNFGAAIYGGLKRNRAILFTFLAQLSCIIGGIIAIFFLKEELLGYLLSIAAGSFLYISTSDLIPELHKEPNFKKSIKSFILFVLGLLLIALFKHL